MRIDLALRCLVLIGLSWVLTACGSMVEFKDMAESLDADVGKPAPNTAVGNASFYKYHDVDHETYELTWIRPDECSYSLVVRKVDRTIVGWRFLKSPPPIGCKFQQVRQLM